MWEKPWTLAVIIISLTFPAVICTLLPTDPVVLYVYYWVTLHVLIKGMHTWYLTALP